MISSLDAYWREEFLARESEEYTWNIPLYCQSVKRAKKTEPEKETSLSKDSKYNNIE